MLFSFDKKDFWASIIIILGVIGFLYFSSQIQQVKFQKIREQDKKELQVIFSQAILDGIISDLPAPDTTFTIVSSHGGDPYAIFFTNSAGKRRGYYVRKHFPTKNVWNFQSLSEKSHVFTHELQNKQ